MVTLPAAALDPYERFSRYNSPYPAHDDGCAVDLYPARKTAYAPVSGEVRSIRTVQCPEKPYGTSVDHLVCVDCGDHIARLLHVDPAVEVGEHIEVGDRIGTLIRSGFFARWVDHHLHVGFRDHGQNIERASGSLPLTVDVPVEGVGWSGYGTVIEAGQTYVVLDAPGGNEEGFVALTADDGTPLDGGLPHYDRGGAFGAFPKTVSLLGTEVGHEDGRGITWCDVEIRASGRAATGLSLFASRGSVSVKLVFGSGHDVAVGDELTIAIEPSEG
ncbi:peptidase M23 family protein [Natronomonas pharaonis DSM 2160]|uniref:Peptidase M23 family protein n=1 Tax=Natronomonas pharaonis (strain ATCC 35678 / DSM 2160 / CIP 103997 / JCM 8858 / NBRC 14720 / NCIMB 2260 / Gabara) TaxID=348780 RepID=A0A1U7EVC4_NATPD|nr:peptidoglycan DD-metalloendopeptidase family protein [Natronomonas pharaonis]CAI48942.1 peptidase M23 family protein [Natronomonas pharaonis DSM 2160]